MSPLRIFMARWGGVLILLFLLMIAVFIALYLHLTAAFSGQPTVSQSSSFLGLTGRAFVFDALAIVGLLIYFRLCARKVHADTFVGLFEISTLVEVVGSGSYREPDPPPRGLWGFDVLFPGWPIWKVVYFPTKRFLLHFDAIPTFTKKDGDEEELEVRADTSLYVELRHQGLRLLLSKVGDLTRTADGNLDLSRDVPMKYSALDAHSGEMVLKEYNAPKMAEYVKDLVEQVVHASVRTVCPKHPWSWLKEQLEPLLGEILDGVRPQFLQLGLIDQGGNEILDSPMFVVEQIALDPELRKVYSEPQMAKLRADALAVEGRGLWQFIETATQAGVNPDAVLAARALERTPTNVTVVASQGGLLGAVGANILGSQGQSNP